MARPFRKPANGPRLTTDQMARQGRVLDRAIEKLGATDAMTFLNNQDDQLGGRPLDLAIASVDGLNAVEARLDGLADRARPSVPE